jgi:biopolymer transport protein ExbB
MRLSKLIIIISISFGTALIAQVPSSPAESTAVQEPAVDVSTEPDRTPDSSQNGFLQSLILGGPVMIIIVILAIGGLTLIIERTQFFIKHKMTSTKLLNEHLQSIRSSSNANFREEAEEELRTEMQIYASRMERGISLINGIGNVAPVVGFFGTVLGMIEAFASIAAAATVNAKVVASGIQVALVTTAGGLSVAVPILLFYHFYLHYVQRHYADGDEFINILIKDLPRLSNEANEN